MRRVESRSEVDCGGLVVSNARAQSGLSGHRACPHGSDSNAPCKSVSASEGWEAEKRLSRCAAPHELLPKRPPAIVSPKPPARQARDRRQDWSHVQQQLIRTGTGPGQAPSQNHPFPPPSADPAAAGFGVGREYSRAPLTREGSLRRRFARVGDSLRKVAESFPGRRRCKSRYDSVVLNASHPNDRFASEYSRCADRMP